MGDRKGGRHDGGIAAQTRRKTKISEGENPRGDHLTGGRTLGRGGTKKANKRADGETPMKEEVLRGGRAKRDRRPLEDSAVETKRFKREIVGRERWWKNGRRHCEEGRKVRRPAGG